MYKKRIKYRDFHGLDREETFDFDLSEPEIVLLESKYTGSITEMLKVLSDKETASTEIAQILHRMILMSYGVISEDGRRFMKSEELKKEFEETGAFSVLFMELSRDATAAAQFFEKVLSNEILRD